MHKQHDHAETSTEEYIKFSLILVLILTAANILYYISDSAGAMDWVRWFMGTFLATFAGFKFAGYKMFVEMFPMYDLVAARSKLYAHAYPFIELGLAGLFLFDLIPEIRAFLVIMIMGAGAVGIINTTYVKKKKIHCACLGNIIKLPLSTVSLAEDVGMVAMAVWMLIA